ncbi:MAG TPA: penicillin-binding transpeptidase domain-containing protein [Vicinamibacteria bacterium]|jgi:penicillin-binding protein 2|nr:penicillin-binding transpeptidase domain-containing protein [Vicinamibacteria bacterium]
MRIRMGGLLLLFSLAAAALPAASPSAPRVRPPAIILPMVIAPPRASERDLAVGEACRRELEGTGGAAVAMDPRTGRVLAVVNPGNALLRAYQPCSVFKIVVAIAGLSEGVITPETSYNCQKGCNVWPGHGPITLRRALAVSCNTYFESIGEQLGYERIQRYAHLLGLGSPSGINLTGETAGRVPEAVRPELVGHLSSHAAGITTTAVQLAVLLSATINGGILFQPQVGGPDDFVPKERWRLPEGTRLDGLAEGFLGAVNEGSAASAFDPDIVVAGKTGSCSQLGWFASYAPADRPELVIVVFMRRGNGHRASAVAGRIYQDLYKGASPPAAAGGF